MSEEKRVQCEDCGLWPAEVSVTTVIGGNSITKRLCRQCVKKYQAGDIPAILAAVFSSFAQKKRSQPDKTCPECQLTFEEFQKTGKLGCAACYRTFREELKPILTRVQGRIVHAGKKPYSDPVMLERDRKVNELRKKMEKAVQEERYEDAAGYRDEIRVLQNSVPADAEGGTDTHE